MESQDAYHLPDPLPSLTSLDSAFQLQEYIALLVKVDVHDVQRIVTLPTRRDDDSASSEEENSTSGDDEKTVDEYCWIYEQLRRVVVPFFPFICHVNKFWYTGASPLTCHTLCSAHYNWSVIAQRVPK